MNIEENYLNLTAVLEIYLKSKKNDSVKHV